MLLFLIVLIIILVTISMVTHNKVHARLLFLCAVTLGIFWCGLFIFIAKKGGINHSVELILFGTKEIKEVLQFRYIPLKTQSYLVAIGRYTFPYCMVLFSFSISEVTSLKRLKLKWFLFLVLPVLSLILYFPPLFEYLSQQKPFLIEPIMDSTLVWVFGYIFFSWSIIIDNFRHISSRLFKDRFLLSSFPSLSMSLLFLFYVPQDPAQIFLFYRNEMMANKGLWYLNKGLNSSVYLAIVIVSLVSALLGFITLYRQVQVQWNEEKEEAVLRQKNITASNGANIFVHGIKNQLLANKILNKRLIVALEKYGIQEEAILHIVDDIKDNNTQMLLKIDSLYRSFRQNEIYLIPLSCDELIEKSIQKFKKKYQDGRVHVFGASHLFLLGDITYLSEAFYNLLTNGYEAEMEKNSGSQAPLLIHITEERLHILFTITDYGIGISSLNKKKILEPFFSSKNSLNSWGMGINYSMKIIKDHMGSMKYESHMGCTSVYVTLPKYKGKSHE